MVMGRGVMFRGFIGKTIFYQNQQGGVLTFHSSLLKAMGRGVMFRGFIVKAIFDQNQQGGALTFWC